MTFLAFAALVCVQAFPGYAFVRHFRLGWDEGERLTVGLVLAGPLAAGIFALSRHFDSDRLYWALHLVLLLVGLGFSLRRSVATDATDVAEGGSGRSANVPSPARSGIVWRRVLALTFVIVAGYGLSVGRLSIPSHEGELRLDRSLQRDTLFHIGIVRSLEDRAQPTLLSFSDRDIGYHVGYHLQLAAWARHLDIDAIDSVIRWGPSLQLSLFVLTAFCLGRRFVPDPDAAHRSGLWSAVLAFGTGFGCLFFFVPSVDWWSLLFMDATLVSVFFPNPLLPALALLFVCLSFLKDDLENPHWGARLVFAVSGGFLILVKMFAGVQLLAAVGLAALYPQRPKSILRSGAALAGAMAFPLVHTFFAATESNTSVSVFPLELIRYTLEKLRLPAEIALVRSASDLGLTSNEILPLVGLLVFWIVGFWGVRLLALGELLRALYSASAWRRVAAWFAVMGFPISLVFRIAPSDARDFSRIEAQNDVIWFATQSGVLLWFFLSARLARGAKEKIDDGLANRSSNRPGFYSRLLTVFVVVFAFAGTIQHFVYQAMAGTDRINADRIEAAEVVKNRSSRDEVWLSPPDRVHPSWIVYWSGRPVVYDSYVGYDYMFAGRAETELRRHAIAQFWRNRDFGFQLWFLKRFRVSWIWQDVHRATESNASGAEPVDGIEDLGPLEEMLDLEFENAAARLWSVNDYRQAATGDGAISIQMPDRIPMGRRGALYLGDGFSSPTGRPSRRVIAPGTRAVLFVPHGHLARLQVELDVNTGSSGGILRLGANQVSLSSGRQLARLTAEPAVEGLSQLGLDWLGGQTLLVYGIRLMADDLGTN